MLVVGILGPTCVIADDGSVVEVGARRQSEVLAVLAAHRGRQVASETIADLVWRGSPPASAAVTLQGYVSRLRQLLEPGRRAREAGTALLTTGDGYRLALGTDLDLVEEAVARARGLLADQPLVAAQLAADALSRWRGPSYADVRDVDELVPEIERVDELHASTRELRAQALLAAGQDAEVVPDLRQVVAAHPLRERGHTLLATALFRSGRQADALAVLRELRERLVEELGVDPGPEVAELEQRLLKQDPSLLARRESVRRQATSGFAGREPELAALRAAWARARAGHLVTSVVRGEPGIGKTTLVEEFVARTVGPEGSPVRWGRCTAAAGAPAYWPWAQVLGGLPETGADQEAGRFALGLDLAAQLRRLAGTTGAVVVLDDAQWADADSLVVLEVALGTLGSEPLVVVLTLRDERPRAPEELDRVLAACARRPGHVDLTLTGLTPQEAGALVDLPVEQAVGLVERTGGNPFFLRSIAALGPGAAVPGTVRDTVRQRVASLPAGAAEVMAVLAVAGREVPLVAVADAAGRTVDAIEEPLAAALRGGLLEEPAPGRLRVAHDLVREAVVADLTPIARRSLHARLAAAYAEVGIDAVAVVAEHRLAAAAGQRDDRAGEAALGAARSALGSAALEEAEEMARRGLEAAGDPLLRSSLHRVAGVAARRLGRLDASEQDFRTAVELARQAGDWVAVAQTALESAPGGVGGYWSLFALPLLGGSALLDEALTRVDDLPADLRARLLAAAATQRAGAGIPGAADLAERAMAEAGADRDARARALVSWVIATWTPDLAEERLAAVEELLSIARHDPGLEATAHHLHRSVLQELGRTADAARAARAFADLAARERDPDLLLLDTWWRIGQLVNRGETERARLLAAEAERASATVSPTAAMVDRVSRATVEGISAWHSGRLLEAVPEAVDLAAEVDPDFLLVVALGHAEAGHRDAALQAVDRLLVSPAEGQRSVPRTVMLTEALVALRDADRLGALVPTLRSWGDRIIVQWPGDVCMGPVALYLGGALGVLGERAEARRLLEHAAVQAEAAGLRPFVARAQRRLAEMGR